MADLHAAYNEVEQLMDHNNFPEAITRLEGILEQDPAFVLAHLALARVYTKTGQHAEAIERAKKACELEPNDPFNYTAMSVTYQRAWAGTQDQQYIALAEDAMAKAQQLQSM
jgi:predicted Zn-dependent protease